MMERTDWPTLPAAYFTTADPPGCSCLDWRYRPERRPCKHVKTLREAYETIKAANRKWDMVKGETTQGGIDVY